MSKKIDAAHRALVAALDKHAALVGDKSAKPSKVARAASELRHHGVEVTQLESSARTSQIRPRQRNCAGPSSPATRPGRTSMSSPYRRTSPPPALLDDTGMPVTRIGRVERPDPGDRRNHERDLVTPDTSMIEQTTDTPDPA